MYNGRRVSLVLGGGGLKGLAHIGVLKVLATHGIVPDEYVGTSVGSIVAALAASGLAPREIERIALDIRRADILDYDWKGLLLRRGRVRSLYRGVALRSWLRRVLPFDRFEQLATPAYFTAVDVNSGEQVVWGRPDTSGHPLHECVASSCAIPGIYPPMEIAGRHYLDGSLVDTLPVRMATVGRADLILAVYLDEVDAAPTRSIQRLGIGAIMEQAQSIVSKTLMNLRLHRFHGATVVIIRPRVRSHGMFQFDRTGEVIRAGEEAALRALAADPALKRATPARPPTRIWRRQPDHLEKRAGDGLSSIPGPEGLPEGGAATS
ncbi:MAG TPA: patatin-like phospholipase family protein [Planctomycetota bacterium]|nr:patatin-like phospholipase family protein [Planctomycetota bacterium]